MTNKIETTLTRVRIGTHPKNRENVEKEDFDAILKHIDEIRARFAGAGPGGCTGVFYIDKPTSITDDQLVQGISEAAPVFDIVEIAKPMTFPKEAA